MIKRYAGLLWLMAIGTLILSAFGLGLWHWLDLPTSIGIASGFCGLLSLIAIMLLEEVRPLQ